MVSSVWREILERAELPKGGVVVEIAPGFKSKITSSSRRPLRFWPSAGNTAA
jgi:hypothetical protein